MMLVDLQIHDSVASLKLNRVEAHNAINSALLSELQAYVQELHGRDDVRVVILSGEGNTFCAGADLKERLSMNDNAVLAFVRQISACVDGFAKLPMPTVAVLNGNAFGGGFELALAADLRVMAADALVGLTECAWGIIPGAGGTQRLTRLVGVGRAKELIFTAARITAGEALSLGVVNRVAPKATVFDEARNLVNALLGCGPIALKLAKAAIDKGADLPMADALLVEQRCYEGVIATQDRLEGLKAFAEKRRPVFSGV